MKKKIYSTPAFYVIEPTAEELCASLTRSSGPAETGKNYYGDGGDNYAKQSDNTLRYVWDDSEDSEDY